LENKPEENTQNVGWQRPGNLEIQRELGKELRRESLPEKPRLHTKIKLIWQALLSKLTNKNYMNKTIQEAVAERITQAKDEIIDSVINQLAQSKITERVNDIIYATNTINEIVASLNNIEGKYDIVSYDSNGDKIESYSETRLKEIADRKQAIADLSGLMYSALEKNTEEAYNLLQYKLYINTANN